MSVIQPRLAKTVRKFADLKNENWSDKDEKNAFNSPFVKLLDFKLSPNTVYERVFNHYNPRSSDVIIVNYVKAGMTWTTALVKKLQELQVFGKLLKQEILQLGMNVEETMPWLEINACMPDYLNRFRAFDQQPTNMVRIFKSHSPVHLLKKPTDVSNAESLKIHDININGIIQDSNCHETLKANLPASPAQDQDDPNAESQNLEHKLNSILLMRNPLDQIVSGWHHHRAKSFFEYTGDFDNYFENFLKGNVENGCYFQYHEEFLKEYYENKAKNNFLIVKYDDMLKDGGYNTIKNLANFLNFNRYLSESKIREIMKLTDFNKMRKLAGTYGFYSSEADGINVGKDTKFDLEGNPGDRDNFSYSHIRNGQLADWKNYLTEEQINKWKLHVEEKVKTCPYLLEYVGLDYLLGYP